MKLKHYGIDQTTMEFGENRITFQSKKQAQQETSDQNKQLFLDLMNAYAESCGSGYRQWLQGVWAITHVSREYFWDPEKLAVAWSEKLTGYSGPNEVLAKVRQYNSEKGIFSLAWVLSKVGDDARKAFGSFKRIYAYHDYTQILAKPLVDIDVVKEYVEQAFVRVDHNTNVQENTNVFGLPNAENFALAGLDCGSFLNANHH